MKINTKHGEIASYIIGQRSPGTVIVPATDRSIGHCVVTDHAKRDSEGIVETVTVVELSTGNLVELLGSGLCFICPDAELMTGKAR